MVGGEPPELVEKQVMAQPFARECVIATVEQPGGVPKHDDQPFTFGTPRRSAGYDGTVRACDVHTPESAPIVLHGHQGVINAVARAADGRHLASTADDGSVRVWDWRAPRSAPTVLHGHEGPQTASRSRTNDGRDLASAGEDGTVRMWNRRTPQAVLTTINADQDAVMEVVFADDGRHFVSSSLDGNVFVWLSERYGEIKNVLSLARARMPRSIGQG